MIQPSGDDAIKQAIYEELKKKYITPQQAYKPIYVTDPYTKYSMIFPFEPAQATIEVDEDFMTNAYRWTCRIGKIHVAWGVTKEAWADADPYQQRAMLKEGFRDIIAVRPDVLDLIDKVIPVEYNEKYALPSVKKGGVGRNPLISKWKFLKEYVVHPVTKADNLTLEDVIIELNDKYDWSRESVAEWLETLSVDITIGKKVQENGSQPHNY